MSDLGIGLNAEEASPSWFQKTSAVSLSATFLLICIIIEQPKRERISFETVFAHPMTAVIEA